MKKYIYASTALAAMLFAACSSEDVVAPGAGANVNFTVDIPAGLQSRAGAVFGDGTTATDLTYAVYAVGDDADTHIATLDPAAAIKFDSNLKASVSLNLVTGKEYKIVFWAQNPDAPYAFDKDAATITVTETGDSHVEARDAFFKMENFTVSGVINKSVELTRPFAQVNIGTSDLADFTNGGGSISASGMAVKAPSKLNLITGEASEEKDYTFANAAHPTGQTFPASTADKPYDYLAMNYILMGADKQTVDVTWTSDNAAASSVVFNSVPVQRNYRTNIYGALLTNPAEFTVEIKPGYGDNNDQEHNFAIVADINGFTEAFDEGKNIRVPKGVVIELPSDRSYELKDGQEIAVEGDINTNKGYQFQVGEGVEATIKGVPGENNIIKGKDNDVEGRGIVQVHTGGVLNMENITLTTNYNPRGWTIDVEGGTVNLKNVNVVCDNAAVCTIEGSTVNIDGGHYSSTASSDGGRQHNYTVQIKGEGSKGYIKNATVDGVQGGISVGNGAYCEIDGGVYTAAPQGEFKNSHYALYVYTNAVAEVKSGYFKSTKYAVYNGNNDTTDIFAARISLYGGFYSDNGYNQETGEKVIEPAEGYEYVATDNAEYPWQVVKKEVSE